MESDWNCVLMVQVGVSARGTLDDAQEMVNKLAGHLEQICISDGITFKRGKHIVVRKKVGHEIDNGGVSDPDEQTNTESAEELLEQHPQ